MFIFVYLFVISFFLYMFYIIVPHPYNICLYSNTNPDMVVVLATHMTPIQEKRMFTCLTHTEIYFIFIMVDFLFRYTEYKPQQQLEMRKFLCESVGSSYIYRFWFHSININGPKRLEGHTKFKIYNNINSKRFRIYFRSTKFSSKIN